MADVGFNYDYTSGPRIPAAIQVDNFFRKGEKRKKMIGLRDYVGNPNMTCAIHGDTSKKTGSVVWTCACGVHLSDTSIDDANAEYLNHQRAKKENRS